MTGNGRKKLDLDLLKGLAELSLEPDRLPQDTRDDEKRANGKGLPYEAEQEAQQPQDRPREHNTARNVESLAVLGLGFEGDAVRDEAADERQRPKEGQPLLNRDVRRGSAGCLVNHCSFLQNLAQMLDEHLFETGALCIVSSKECIK